MQPFPWSNGVISSLLVTRIRNIYLCSQQSLAVSLEEIESLLAIILLHYWTHRTSLLFELQALKTKSSPCSQKFSLVRSNNFIYSSFLLSATRSTCTLLKLTYGAWEKVWTVCMGLLVTSERWRSNLFSTEATSEHLTPQRCACYVVLKEILQRSGQKLGRIAHSRDNLTVSGVGASYNEPQQICIHIIHILHGSRRLQGPPSYPWGSLSIYSLDILGIRKGAETLPKFWAWAITTWQKPTVDNTHLEGYSGEGPEESHFLYFIFTFALLLRSWIHLYLTDIVAVFAHTSIHLFVKISALLTRSYVFWHKFAYCLHIAEQKSWI